MLTKSNARGYAVLAALFAKLSDEQVREIYVEPYLNGRECGFAVLCWTDKNRRKAVFSNHRNADLLNVYRGNQSEFSMQGNSLSEGVYQTVTYFKEEAYAEAAQCAFDFIFEDFKPFGA